MSGKNCHRSLHFCQIAAEMQMLAFFNFALKLVVVELAIWFLFVSLIKVIHRAVFDFFIIFVNYALHLFVMYQAPL